MRKKRIGIIATLLVGIVLASSTSYAFFGFGKFRGGTVHDILRVVKEKIETAKLGELSQFMDTSTEYIKEYYALTKQVETFHSTIKEASRMTNILSKAKEGILSTDTDAVYRIANLQFDEEEGNYLDIKKALAATQEHQQKEINRTIDTATESASISDQMDEKTKEIIRLADKGVISEAQKLALLRSLRVQMQYADSKNEMQMFANTVSTEAAKESEKQAVRLISKSYEFAPLPDIDVYNQQLEKERIHLPK